MKTEHNRPIILLIDDNDEILEFLATDLGEQYQVLTAHDGQEALARIDEHPVELVISDVMMPVMDGFEFCKKIKSQIETSHIPVILLTAKNTLEAKISGLELGADAYIEKPFSPAHLHVQITNLLQNRAKIWEHFSATPLTHLRSMATTEADEKFLEEVNTVVEQHIEDSDLDVEKLAKYMNMSRPTFYRKLKDVAGLTPNEVIHITRLKKAAALLSSGKYSINEVAAMAGYTSATHFGRNFQKQFGITPSEFIRQGR